MGNRCSCAIVLFAFCWSVACTSQAKLPNPPTQSVGEFYKQYHENRAAASRQLGAIFERVRARAVAHYKATGDITRADYIATMKPDLLNLEDRIATATLVKADASVDSVVQKYIVDASSQFCCEGANH